jgi:hypothetical protein
MYAPIVRSARTIRRYRAGRYEAALFTDIEAEGSIGYEYLVAVFEPGIRDPFLLVSSERNNPAADAEFLRELGLEPQDIDTSNGSHFLCVFDEEGHHNLGPSDEWADLEAFEKAALRVLAQRLGETPRVTS